MDDHTINQFTGKVVTIRDLRMWHWRKVVTHRSNAERFEKHSRECLAAGTHKKNELRHPDRQARINHRIANFHLKAVQALNDVPELRSTTAEQDLSTRDLIEREVI